MRLFIELTVKPTSIHTPQEHAFEAVASERHHGKAAIEGGSSHGIASQRAVRRLVDGLRKEGVR